MSVIIPTTFPPSLLISSIYSVAFYTMYMYRLSLVQLTKLKVGIAWADVVEGAHESFKNESYAHGIVDSKELRHSMGL